MKPSGEAQSGSSWKSMKGSGGSDGRAREHSDLVDNSSNRREEVLRETSSTYTLCYGRHPPSSISTAPPTLLNLSNSASIS